MCLAVPVRVETLLGDDEAIVMLNGVKKAISISLLDEVKVGDYVILHVGYALSKLDEDEANKTLLLIDEMHRQFDDELDA